MSRLDAEKIPSMAIPRSADSITEIAILLESPMMQRLEAAAHAQGMSAGALVRCLIRDFLCYSDSGASLCVCPEDSRTASLC